ncbi:MlaE family lipid ABC transporter permease subunit [Thalassococcus profundi]|uniref:MlaE family lipid ABC transporter permease subunit n=1 Tax=Thalassococcus profundi TaxID=2282382 RepID=A0A369TY16_9RHOB|nr:MlaE family lipid ABC transporter permease subunit [Thalassococcus profundi]RDD67836.1 MlaE family lipid ABC transporter permease subunit [Thalassococcus profundi]
MPRSPAHEIRISDRDGVQYVVLSGAHTVSGVAALLSRLNSLRDDAPVRVDLSELSRMDTAAAWALVTTQKRIEAAEQRLTIEGADDGVQSLLDTVANSLPEPQTETPKTVTIADRLEALGRSLHGALKFLAALTGYFGLFLSRLARAVRHPSEFRLTSLVHHCQEVGLRAVPIVALLAFLIGVVLAFQGATQLRQFGAEVYVVDLLAISILRELGILLTSIIVAGRTASAFTAAIGSMKMREEIDAMRTLGLDPAQVLFVPRILALLLMLPILGLIANVTGLVGGALMAWIDLGISPKLFVTRLIEDTSVDQLTIGMVKAPVFAMLIGVIGCHAGMQVKSNAESLGAMTSSAVVQAIFAVIVADAVFSVFFAQLGL